MTKETVRKRKLIEVALPLAAINRESARENYIYKGNPSSVHKWWSQKPLGASRAVLFAQLVDDPASLPERFPTPEKQEAERQRLFRIIEDLSVWENSFDPSVLASARREIQQALHEQPVSILDPFCGAGSIPLEAQRLGLDSFASDLNPVAVLITKAVIDFPARFSGVAPVGNLASAKGKNKRLVPDAWVGAAGLAHDIRAYGKWLCEEAERRLRPVYPRARDGSECLAWLWARVVQCPNPACKVDTPLVSKFWLSTKKKRQRWAAPVYSKKGRTFGFELQSTGTPPDGTVTARGARCMMCNTTFPLEHVRAESCAGRVGARLMAVVTKGAKGRDYHTATSEHELAARVVAPERAPDTSLPEQALGFRVQRYGMLHHRDLFTPRQLLALCTYGDLVREAREQVIADARRSGRFPADDKTLDEGGSGAIAYADAIATYLAFACDKMAMYSCGLVPWYTAEDRPFFLFGRQAISMTWDFVEVNPLSDMGGAASKSVQIVADSIAPLRSTNIGVVAQADASERLITKNAVISTDPPYYDYVPYADLSDFFYTWLRRNVGHIFPSLFGTLLVPKAEDLTADEFRHGSKGAAESHFTRGIARAFSLIRASSNTEFPVTIYYAFKQTESEDEEDADAAAPTTSVKSRTSRGWETMLEGLLSANFMITGTWPLRTERTGRLREAGSNALASSIVLVCRPRVEAAPTTRREFIAKLKRELPIALRTLQKGYIAPVDFAQAAIGPGMSIFSSFSKVLEADGASMTVRTALQLINQELDTFLAAEDGHLDRDSSFCLTWFEQYGFQDGPFGEADVLARAKNTSVQRLLDQGIVRSKGGRVGLSTRHELVAGSNKAIDLRRAPIWLVAQQLVHVLEADGEQKVSDVARAAGDAAEHARSIAYRLFALCERKGLNQDATAYNSLVSAWPEIARLAASSSGDSSPRTTRADQAELFGEG